MSFKLDQGLFNLDFTDSHAILGISVDAEVKDIRKRYLTVARLLHPDSCATDNEADRKQASEFLSKLVNPAYEKLSQERNYTDYCVILRLKGQQALKQQDTVSLTSDLARRLAASRELENFYKAALRELAEKQYQQLDQVLEVTGQISELNLVYLMRKEGKGESVGTSLKQPSLTDTTSTGRRSPTPPSLPQKTPQTREAIVESYLRRAKEFEAKQDYQRAVIELRDAIKMEPGNSTCQSRLGVIYFKTNQLKMAKIYFEQALKLNPQDAVALEGKRRLEAPDGGKSTASKPDAKGSKPAPKGRPAPKGGKPDAKGNSGGLFGLFGSKKK